jgi:hypothetical protein
MSTGPMNDFPNGEVPQRMKKEATLEEKKLDSMTGKMTELMCANELTPVREDLCTLSLLFENTVIIFLYCNSLWLCLSLL